MDGENSCSMNSSIGTARGLAHLNGVSASARSAGLRVEPGDSGFVAPARPFKRRVIRNHAARGTRRDSNRRLRAIGWRNLRSRRGNADSKSAASGRRRPDRSRHRQQFLRQGSLFGPLVPKLLADGFGRAFRQHARARPPSSNAATIQGPKRLGSAYENVDDCRHDIAAWCDFFGFFRAVFQVGSRSSVTASAQSKAVHSLTHSPHRRGQTARCDFAAATFASILLNSEHREEFFDAKYHAAEQAVAAGGSRPTPGTSRFHSNSCSRQRTISTSTGPAERFNVLNQIDQLRLPSLFVFGESRAHRRQFPRPAGSRRCRSPRRRKKFRVRNDRRGQSQLYRPDRRTLVQNPLLAGGPGLISELVTRSKTARPAAAASGLQSWFRTARSHLPKPRLHVFQADYVKRSHSAS